MIYNSKNKGFTNGLNSINNGPTNSNIGGGKNLFDFLNNISNNNNNRLGQNQANNDYNTVISNSYISNNGRDSLGY